MGYRFRRSVKILPGVRLNFNKNSTSVSVGGKGHKYTVSSTGRETVTHSIPGTGVSYTQTVKSAGHTTQKKAASPKTYKVCGILFIILAVLTLIVFGIPILAFSFVGFIIVLVIAALMFRGGLRMYKRGKE